MGRSPGARGYTLGVLEGRGLDMCRKLICRCTSQSESGAVYVSVGEGVGFLGGGEAGVLYDII